MSTLKVELGQRSYDIEITGQGLAGLGAAVMGLKKVTKLALVTNPTVGALYGAAVAQSLRAQGFSLMEITVPDGEEHKDIKWVEHMLSEMLRARLDRGSALVALGGGVIGDMAGFAASLYMRGIRFIQVPTTLLAQVDSSVGGKTGVNHPLGKNMIGTFWQPSLVWIDLGTLKTLPVRELRAGMAEVIKYGVIWDSEFFEYLLKNRDRIMALEQEAMEHVIHTSCSIKAQVVSLDEREGGLRAILNYGHTIGHAVETVTGYTKYLHGEAVAIGMHYEALVAERMGIAKAGTAGRIKELSEAYGLPVMIEGLGADELCKAMELDKKTLSGQMRFVLPERIGKVQEAVPVGADVVAAVLSK